MNNIKDRNQIFAFRTTKDFTKKFDELCERLGYCRSVVVRYTQAFDTTYRVGKLCLKETLPQEINSAKSFSKRSDCFGEAKD